MTSGTAKIIETPPLREGDRLSAEEFHRRYEAMPELRNAHLIDGVVRMSSPIRADQHGEPHALVIGWLHDYRRKLRGIRLTDNTTFRIDADNEPQPDAVMFLDPSRAGSAWIADDGYLHGVPELIVEIAGSSSRLDGSLNANSTPGSAWPSILSGTPSSVALNGWASKTECFKRSRPTRTG